MTKFNVNRDTLIGLIGIAFGVTVFFLATPLPADAAMFPRILSVCFCSISALLTAKGLFFNTKTETGRKADSNTHARAGLLEASITYVSLALYIAAFRFLNYYIATALFLGVLLTRNKIGSWWKILLIVAAFLAVMYFVFAGILGVRL